MKGKEFSYLAVIAVLFCVSCSSSERTAIEAPGDAHWNLGNFVAHIEALNTHQGSGRRAGTVHHAGTVNYVVSQNKAIGLQPGLESFNVPYLTDRNTIVTFDVSVDKRDSLLLVPGYDIVPDGRSSSGDVVVRRFLTGIPVSTTADEALAVVLDKQSATTAVLRRIRKMNYSSVFVVGELDYHSGIESVADLVVFQITSTGFGGILGISEPGVRSIVSGGSNRTFNFPEPISLMVESKFESRITQSNIVGMLPGNSPVRSGEAIVVAAIFGVGGRYATIPTFGYGDLGIGTSAILELGRKFASGPAIPPRLDRTLIFVHLDAADIQRRGISAFFENPVWSNSAVEKLVLIGPTDQQLNDFMAVSSEYGIEVEALPLIVPEEYRKTGFVGRRTNLFGSGVLRDDRSALGRHGVRDTFDGAAKEAIRLTDEAYILIRNLAADSVSRSMSLR